MKFPPLRKLILPIVCFLVAAVAVGLASLTHINSISTQSTVTEVETDLLRLKRDHAQLQREYDHLLNEANQLHQQVVDLSGTTDELDNQFIWEKNRNHQLDAIVNALRDRNAQLQADAAYCAGRQREQGLSKLF